MKCQNCTYYHYRSTKEFYGKVGDCRRNAPHYSKGVINPFPTVKEIAWCGEFKERT